jgi:asparagine synthetase B (glutamine-hydrolysing)
LLCGKNDPLFNDPEGGRLMCGIAGEVRFRSGIADAAAVATMMRSQSRRGPDACGQLMRGRVGLGHQRLNPPSR